MLAKYTCFTVTVDNHMHNIVNSTHKLIYRLLDALLSAYLVSVGVPAQHISFVHT